MLNFTNTTLTGLSVHQVGNKSENQDIRASKDTLNIQDESLNDLLLKFFLQHFKTPEYYAFTGADNTIQHNRVYTIAEEIFDNPSGLHLNSIQLAKHLYDCSEHPNIKAGDFFVAYFENILHNDSYCAGIGLFKVENKDAFLQLENIPGGFKLHQFEGINPDKLDKGCLILDTDRENGFKVCTVDRSNRSADAHYWKDDFLEIIACKDNFHFTSEYLQIAKGFVTEQLQEEFEVSKADQIDLLNRSVEYFKTQDHFNEKEFTANVFGDENVIDSFQRYKEQNLQTSDFSLVEDFDISAPAVKKQSKIFKSVLKLDKNFHIYIHGNKELIEKGTDSDGRKFYKIYYNEEE